MKLISNVLPWTPTRKCASVGWLTRTQLGADFGDGLEDLPGVMNSWNRWGERVREIYAVSVTWWWWWWYIYRNLPQVYIYHYRAIGQKSRAFADGPGDRGSIPGWVIPKTQKMVLNATLLNTQHYKVWIKVKVEQSREWSSALPYTSV